MSVVDTVKKIVGEAAKAIPGASVVAPLAVWDSNGTSMGVQIRAPQNRGGQPCEITANFVLTRAELSRDAEILKKATLAVKVIQADIQVQIRPLAKLVDNSQQYGGRI